MRFRHSSGTTLTEVLVALLVLATVVSASLTVFMMAHRKATMTRMRAGAVIIAESFFEEVADHQYGEPRNDWWPAPQQPQKVSFPTVLEGRSAPSVYQLSVHYANGSFVDSKKPNSEDEVTLTVSWMGKHPQSLELTRRVWKR